MSGVVLSPVVGHFFKAFTMKEDGTLIDGIAGVCVGNMDALTIGDELHCKGGYFVCRDDIVKAPKNLICFEGPGGALIAGRRVALSSKEIRFIGSLEEPVIVVGVEGIALKADTLAMEYVKFFIVGQEAPMEIDATVFSSVREVEFIRLNSSEKNANGHFEGTIVDKLKNMDDLPAAVKESQGSQAKAVGE